MNFPPFVWTKGGQGVCGRRGAGARTASLPLDGKGDKGE